MKFLLLVVSLTIYVFGSNYQLKEKTSVNDISTSKVWNQLIYYKNGVSEINTNDFFLNKEGQKNALKELLSTLNAYDPYNVTNESAICKFPARYKFLSKYVNFENYQEVNPGCEKLSKWEFLNNTDSISLMLVSGYVSNPASTFGHSFIKLNKKGNQDLFSSSINYGALVPENENTAAYVVKGLTGFYEAGFSDKYFYNQDMTYSETEFRDMWEYKLNLTENQKRFILLHVWEIVAKKFDYYFLNKNCGYRVTEVLNLVTKTNFVNENDMWFIPVETFQKLENKEPELIKEIIFRPSNKRIFNAHFSKLTENQKKVTKDLMINKFTVLKEFNKLSENDKIKVLDFLLLFYKQSLTVDQNNEELKRIKEKVLIERFKYGKSNAEKVMIEELSSPAKNTNPISFEVSLGYDNKNKEFTAFSFSPYKQSSLSISNLNFDNLIALETRIGVNKDRLFLDKFDLIKLNKTNIDKNNVLNEFQYNWNVQIGLENFMKEKTHFAKGGVGINLFHDNEFLLYSNLNISLNDFSGLSIIPEVGIEYHYEKMKIRLTQEKEIGILEDKDRDIRRLNLQYNFNKDFFIGYEGLNIDNEFKNLVNMKITF